MTSPATRFLAVVLGVAMAAGAARSAGAATQAGAGSALLIASGVHAGDAIAFSVAAQLIVVGTGAIVLLVVGSWHLATRARRDAFVTPTTGYLVPVVARPLP